MLKARNENPYENLIDASMKDIELLILAGTPIYGEMRFIDIFDNSALPKGYTQIKIGSKTMFVKGDPAALYRKVRDKVGFKKKLDYLPFEPV